MTMSRQVASASVGQVYRATMSGREAPDCVPRVDIHLEGSLRKEIVVTCLQIFKLLRFYNRFPYISSYGLEKIARGIT